MKKQIIPKVLPHLTIKNLVLNVSLALVYILSGKLGLSFAVANPSATALWAPTGIALVAILLFGYRVIPAIFFGAFVVNSITAGTIATSIVIAAGNTLEGITGAYFVNKFANGVHAFENASDIFKFTFFAAMLSTTVSANIGVTTLLASGLASWQNFWPIWLTWWLGDMGGNLIIAPFILVWCTNPRIRINYKKAFHFFLALISLFIIAGAVFSGIVPYPYLCIPLAVWIAFWFGQKGATITTLIVTIIAIYYTLHGVGPFSGVSLNRSLILLQMFLSVFSLTALIFAATVFAIRKSEKDLASREQRFQALIEKSSDAVVLVDPTSKILYSSPSVKRVLGFTPKELQNTIGFNLIAPEDRPRTMSTLAKLVLKPGGVMTIEYRVRRKDKIMIWVEATGTNLLFEPSVNAVVVNFHDITEKRLFDETLLQEKMTDEAMLSSIGDGIIATDNKGEITMVNQVTCDTLGWREKELIGKHLVTIAPMEDATGKILPAIDRPLTKVLSHGKEIVTSETHYYMKKDKTKLPVRFTVTPITLNNQLVGTIEVFHDITKEKELDRIKDEFISLASHELRTPMTAIKGFVSMILHGDYGPINEQIKRPLENIQSSTQRQILLINDLLDVSRLQTGRINLTLTPFPIGQTIADIVNLLQPLGQQKGIAIHVEKKQEVLAQGDIEWTKHILNNLTGNALKFTDKGSISFTYRQDHDFVHIAVADTGIGIDPADYHKLFGKFQQLNIYKTDKPVGSGLGLYLSRELARKMGGDVRLEQSQVGHGSTFVLSLPKAETQSAQNAKALLANEIKIALNQETR